MCLLFDENDEEQLTISDFVSKIDDYLRDSKSVAYGKQYFKERLLKRYGNSVFVANGIGFTNIVTFREKSCKIIRDYYNLPRGDEEAHKCAIL